MTTARLSQLHKRILGWLAADHQRTQGRITSSHPELVRALQRGANDLYTGYFIRANPLFPWYISLNHTFLQTVRPISDPLG